MNCKIKQFAVPVLALSVLMSGILSACSSNKPESSAVPTATGAAIKTPDPVTLKLMLFGDKPANLGKVLPKFEETTKDTLNIKL